MKKLLYIFLFLSTYIVAQNNFPLNREWSLDFEHQKNRVTSDSLPLSATNDYSCFKPYIAPLVHQKKYKSDFGDFIFKKCFKESFIIVNDTADKFYLTIDPVINFEYGSDLADTSGERLYKNTRGFIARGELGKHFSFESSFYENQATYPKYVDSYISSTNSLFPQTNNREYNVVPGQGRSKPFRKHGYDYAMASGYISYSPFKILNIQVGHGKHFVGDGYRSLLLSDIGYNYPYARITTTFKNIQYTNLYTSFINLKDAEIRANSFTDRLFQKKIGSFQLLNFNFFHRLQLGLFQGMIWEASDSTNHQHVNFNTFDPVIGVNTFVYGLNNKNNVLLGATFKFKITNSISLYAQYMLDGFNKAGDSSTVIQKKSGYQLGVKYYDLFTVKNLMFQLEFNSVRPYSYSSGNPEQSYTHYNQSLAHPLGANFQEVIGFINYKYQRGFVELKGMYAIKGSDTSAIYNYGGNIFKSDMDFAPDQDLSTIQQNQGAKTSIINLDFHIGCLVNPSTNFNIVLGISNRTLVNDKRTSNTQYVYLSMRTSLANFYYDF